MEREFTFPKHPSELPPVDVPTFKFAFPHVSAAAALKAPVRNPETFGFAIEAANGDVQSYHFGDNGLSRLLVALKDHFKPGREYMSAGMRLMAFGELYKKGAFRDFIRDDPAQPDVMEIHEAVLEIIAVFPLNHKFNFDRGPLLKAIKKRAAEIDAAENLAK